MTGEEIEAEVLSVKATHDRYEALWLSPKRAEQFARDAARVHPKKR